MKNMIRLALLGSLLASASAFAEVPQNSTDESQVVLSLYEIKDDDTEKLVASFATVIDETKPTFSSLGQNVSYIQSCTVNLNGEEEVTEIKPGIKDVGLKAKYSTSVDQGVKNVHFDFDYSVLESIHTFQAKDSACAVELPRVNVQNLSGTFSDSGYEEAFLLNGKKMKVKFEVEKV